MFKKIYLLSLLSLGSGDSMAVSDSTGIDKDEPKQYGVPFTSVADPQDVVLYEVNIRAFSESGNLQGVTEKLDHIKSLGINTIWLMPIHPVGQERSAGGLGSPYAVKNYLEVNPEFGDLNALRRLVEEAHQRKMSVILDWVANHTSWDNPWLKNKSWYTQDSTGNIIIPPGTNWQDVAELNYDNPDLRAAMIHAMKYWVLEANVDGFRCDAVDFIPTDFWKSALDELKAIPQRKLILLAEGGKLDNFTAGFQMNYAWDFSHNIKEVYAHGKSVASIFSTHHAEYKAIPEGKIKLRYTTNHDESAWESTPIESFGSNQAAISASVITLFTSAAPLLYGSQEVGQSQKLSFFTRDPINWEANEEMKEEYVRLFKIYNNTQTFKSGKMFSYNNDDVAVFTRQLNSEEYLVLVNTRKEEKEISLPAALQNSKWINVLNSKTIKTQKKILLSPYQYLILKR